MGELSVKKKEEMSLIKSACLQENICKKTIRMNPIPVQNPRAVMALSDFFVKLTWHKMNDKFFFLTFTNYNGVLRVLSASHDAGNIAACLL